MTDIGSSLLIAVRIGRLGVIEDHVRAHPDDINVKWPLNPPQSLLELAVRFGHANMAHWLLSRGAKETPQSSPALLSNAVITNQLFMVEWCLERGWDPWCPPDASSVTPFVLAITQSCKQPNLDILKALKQHSSPLKTDASGETLLHALINSATHIHPNVINVMTWLADEGLTWSPNTLGQLPGAEQFNPTLLAALQNHWDAITAQRHHQELHQALPSNHQHAPARKM